MLERLGLDEDAVRLGGVEAVIDQEAWQAHGHSLYRLRVRLGTEREAS